MSGTSEVLKLSKSFLSYGATLWVWQSLQVFQIKYTPQNCVLFWMTNASLGTGEVRVETAIQTIECLNREKGTF